MVQDLARSRAADLIPHEVLIHVPGYASGDLTARAERLHGGTVNKSYRVDTSAGRFVVRIHAALAQTLGADHQREAQLHAAAAAVELAPALVHVDPAHRFMVMEFVNGAVWIPEDFARPARLMQLGRALRVLHSVPPPRVAPFDISVLLKAHHERLREAAPQERPWFAELMERAAAALEACCSGQRPRVLIHGDLYHANLIGLERLYLLDWEYGAVTDPLFDLASILAYYPQATPHADTLLDAAGLAGHATPEMLRHATWLYVLVSYFWYRSRRLSAPAPGPVTEAAEQALLKRLV